MNSHQPFKKLAYLPPLALVSAISFLAAGCQEEAPIPAKPKAEVQTAAPVQAAEPMLAADPNPVEGASKTTTISWNVGQGRTGEVYVSSKGGPERLVARGIKGSKEVDWVGPGATPHEFRLYEGKEHKTQLATITVTHASKKSK